MAGIQSNTGIITGVPITETVDKLMAISAKPRQALAARTAALKQEQVAVNDLMAAVIGVELAAQRLANVNTYATRNVASSDLDVLGASISGTPVAGNYTFTPLETASSHQILSGGIADDEAALGASTFSFHLEGDGDTFSVTLDANDTIRDLADKINDLDTDVAATVINDGSGTPYRLSIVATKSGADYEIITETNTTGLTFSEIAEARDARLAIGEADSTIVVTSSKNDFTDVLPGVKLTIKEVSEDPITITVNQSDSGLITNAKLLVDQYNKVRDKVDSYTDFDPNTNSTGILFGDGAVLQVSNQLSSLVSGRIFGGGDIGTLSELGFTLDDKGKLSLDESKLKDRYAEDPESVKDFFATETTGFGARIKAVTQRLAGVDNSVLISRTQSLQRKIEFANERIDYMNERLTKERERMLKTFYDLENIVAKFQSTSNSLAALQSSFAQQSNNNR